MDTSESLNDEPDKNNSQLKNSTPVQMNKKKKKNPGKLDPLFFVFIGIGFVFLLILLYL